MTCKKCGSENVSSFAAEIGIHVAGLKNIDTPAVVVFPELAVCLNCGATLFAIPEQELQFLRKHTAAGTK